MNLERLALVGELLGGVGVLVTLVFLTLEVRKNSRILRANSQTAGMLSFAAYNEMLATDPVLPGLFIRVLAGEDIDSLDPEERFRVTLALRGIIQRIEAAYFQFVEGQVEEPYWAQRRMWLKSIVLRPNIAKWWAVESKSAQVTEAFIAHINSSESSFEMDFLGRAASRSRDQGG